MIQKSVNIDSIYEREIKLPAFHDLEDLTVLPVISVFQLPDTHFLKNYGYEYACIDGHRRLASYKVRHENFINIRVPNSMSDFFLILDEGAMKKPLNLVQTLEGNISLITSRVQLKQIQDNQNHYNVQELRKQYMKVNNLDYEFQRIKL